MLPLLFSYLFDCGSDQKLNFNLLSCFFLIAACRKRQEVKTPLSLPTSAFGNPLVFIYFCTLCCSVKGDVQVQIGEVFVGVLIRRAEERYRVASEREGGY